MKNVIQISRLKFTTQVAVILTAATLSQDLFAKAEKQPNIIIIITHDTGKHFGCYGIGTVNSPNIDKLASEGVRFKNSFCTSPMCSPSRSSVYTGRYPHSNGVIGLSQAEFAWDFKPGEKHLAELLKNAGYRTVLIGTSHESPRSAAELGFTDNITANIGTCRGIARASQATLDTLGKDKQPFYMQIAFFETHRPFSHGGVKSDSSKGVTVPDHLVDEPSAREEFAAYQGAIKNVDASIGLILDALDKRQLSQNTIVLYTVDHGMPFPRAKGTLYDPGIGVACILRWPAGGWSGGKAYDHLVLNTDYVPTLLEAAGIDMPENIQGKSFAPLLNGAAYTPREEIFAETQVYHDPRRCIRTKKYKLIVNFFPGWAVKNTTQTWRPATVPKFPRYPFARHPSIELYHLEADPLESKNLANKPEYAKVRKELTKRIYQWMQHTNDPILEGFPEPPMYRKTIKILRRSME